MGYPTPYVAPGFENVYEPYEDSFFLLDCLEKDESFLKSLCAPLVAEIGTGTGIVTSFVPHIFPKQNYIPWACDVNPAACQSAAQTWTRNWKNDRLDVIRGDLLSFCRPNCVDVLIFNPPYVPTEQVPTILPPEAADSDDRWVDLALDGGENGMEITQKVLDNLEHWLSPNGVAYILFCASNKPSEVCEELGGRGWDSLLVDTRRAGWEILSVYRISRGA